MSQAVCFATLLRIDAHESGEKSQMWDQSSILLVRRLSTIATRINNKRIENGLVCVDPVGDGKPVVRLGGRAVNGVIVLGKHHQSMSPQMREKKKKKSVRKRKTIRHRKRMDGNSAPCRRYTAGNNRCTKTLQVVGVASRVIPSHHTPDNKSTTHHTHLVSTPCAFST